MRRSGCAGASPDRPVGGNSMVEMILLERVEKLGQMGQVVNVRPGFARNYLLPQKKALRATKENLTYFESRRAQLEANNLERKAEARNRRQDRRASPSSSSARPAKRPALWVGFGRDIAEAVSAAGFTIEKRQVVLDRPIKSLGLHPVRVVLHPEVSVTITANVAQSADEAEHAGPGASTRCGRATRTRTRRGCRRPSRRPRPPRRMRDRASSLVFASQLGGQSNLALLRSRYDAAGAPVSQPDRLLRSSPESAASSLRKESPIPD